MHNQKKYYKADFQLSVRRPFALMYSTGLPKRPSPLPDIHYDFHLGILLEGKSRTVYSGFSQVNLPGNVWWTSYWEPHTGPILEDNTALLLITISPESLGNIDTFGEFSWQTPFLSPPQKRPQLKTADERQTVMDFASELINLKSAKPGHWRLSVWLKIHQLIMFLCRNWQPEREKNASPEIDEFSRILPAIELVRGNLCRPVDVPEAAAACGYSRSRFCKLFQEIMNESFGKFALRARLSGAARELVSTLKPVKNIGPDWGFADNPHFTHAFKKFFGCSPSEFRLQGKVSDEK